VGEIFAGLSASEPSPTRRTPEAEAVVRQIVAAHALARDRQIVLAGNDVVGPGLDEALLALAPLSAAV